MHGLRSLLLALALIALQPPSPAQAGLLRPLLELMRPTLESRLAQACVKQLAAGDASLETLLQKPCQSVAVPTSRCLIEETDHSGRGLGILSEMLAGRYGSRERT